MPSADYIPAGDLDLKDWATNFSTKITASPATYGLVAGQATTYAALLTAYTTALTAATTPATRTSVTVAAKDTARATLVAGSRLLVNIIQGVATVTPAQKTELGITTRKTTRTPIGPPATRPLQTIVRSNGPVLGFRLNDELTPDSRAFPFGAPLCQVFMRTGATGGTDLENYTLLATVGKSVNDLNVTSVPTGTQMHFISRYINRRGQPGPQSDVVSQFRTV
jgi:hypothetical protein